MFRGKWPHFPPAGSVILYPPSDLNPTHAPGIQTLFCALSALGMEGHMGREDIPVLEKHGFCLEGQDGYVEQ
jgi:hypothetical protein